MKTLHRNSILLICIALAFALGYSNLYPQKAKRTKERVYQLKLIKLIDILELDDKNSDMFIAKYSEFEKKIELTKNELNSATKELGMTLKKEHSNDDIKKKTEHILSINNKLHELINHKFTQVKTILNDEQYAKYVVFEHQFHKELNRLLLEKQLKCKRNRNNKND